jgi:hypothetical protein
MPCPVESLFRPRFPGFAVERCSPNDGPEIDARYPKIQSVDGPIARLMDVIRDRMKRSSRALRWSNPLPNPRLNDCRSTSHIDWPFCHSSNPLLKPALRSSNPIARLKSSVSHTRCARPRALASVTWSSIQTNPSSSILMTFHVHPCSRLNNGDEFLGVEGHWSGQSGPRSVHKGLFHEYSVSLHRGRFFVHGHRGLELDPHPRQRPSNMTIHHCLRVFQRWKVLWALLASFDAWFEFRWCGYEHTPSFHATSQAFHRTDRH